MILSESLNCLHSSMSSQRVDVIHKGSMALKMHMKMHQEVLAICMVFMGFVLVKKKHGKLYVDVYKTGPRMVPAEKIFSVQLPESAYSVSEVPVKECAVEISA
jgi:hypothetical protein